jgi:hypothetical protein
MDGEKSDCLFHQSDVKSFDLEDSVAEGAMSCSICKIIKRANVLPVPFPSHKSHAWHLLFSTLPMPTVAFFWEKVWRCNMKRMRQSAMQSRAITQSIGSFTIKKYCSRLK